MNVHRKVFRGLQGPHKSFPGSEHLTGDRGGRVTVFLFLLVPSPLLLPCPTSDGTKSFHQVLSLFIKYWDGIVGGAKAVGTCRHCGASPACSHPGETTSHASEDCSGCFSKREEPQQELLWFSFD